MDDFIATLLMLFADWLCGEKQRRGVLLLNLVHGKPRLSCTCPFGSYYKAELIIMRVLWVINDIDSIFQSMFFRPVLKRFHQHSHAQLEWLFTAGIKGWLWKWEWILHLNLHTWKDWKTSLMPYYLLLYVIRGDARKMLAIPTMF